jgi:DNA-binding beta-propeller fold protein YncE
MRPSSNSLEFVARAIRVGSSDARGERTVVGGRAVSAWRLVAIVVAAVAVLPAAAQARRNAYVTGFTSNNAAAFDIAANGALTPVTGSPFATGTSPRGVSMTPDGNHVYVAMEATDTVTTFNVGADGGLTATGAGTTAGNEPRAVAASPDGSHLYVSNAGAGANGNSISAFSIAADGALTELAGSPFATGTTPQGIALTPDGKFLYVANQFSANLSAFAVAADGTLTPLAASTVAVGTEPRGLAVTADGHHLYVANSLASTISAFTVAVDGGLAPIGAPVPTGDTPEDVTITPDGKFLFTPNFAADTVSRFSIGADGGLTTLPAVGAGNGPATAGVTPDGRHLYIPNFSGSTVSGFDVGADGGLTAITGSPFPATVLFPPFPGLAITPNQGPTAAFTATAGSAGHATFSAASSSDSDGTIARYDWSFGDGQSLADGGPTPPAHSYAEPGTYTAELTVTDNEGCSATQVFTGRIALCNGGTRAVTKQQVTVGAPTLTLSGKKKQAADGAVEVNAGCDQQCDVVANGKLKVKLAGAGKRAKDSETFKLKRAIASVSAGGKQTLGLKLPKAARAVFKSGAVSSAKAKLDVSATSATGDEATGRRKVKLRA